MQAEDFPRFRSLLTGMAKLFERDIDAPLLDAYWVAMRDWPLAEFELGCAHLMRTSQYFPRPAAFEALRKGQRTTAGEAFATALEHVRKGRHRDGVKAAPEIERAVRAIGGWQIIGHATDDDLRFVEQRFAKNYSEITQASDVREEVPALARDNPVVALIAGMRRQ
jgi:hypothetical protein